MSREASRSTATGAPQTALADPSLSHSSLLTTSTRTMATKDFAVSIIGGGIGGLSLAIGLLNAGVPVDVFEAAVSAVHTMRGHRLCSSLRASPHRQPQFAESECWRGNGGQY